MRITLTLGACEARDEGYGNKIEGFFRNFYPVPPLLYAFNRHEST